MNGRVYWEQEGVTLYHSRAEDLLPVLACQPTLIFADPPYNVGLAYESTDDRRPGPEYRDWCAAWLAQCRTLCTGAVLVTPGAVNMRLWLAEIEQPRWVMAWTKSFSHSRARLGKPDGYQRWEPILVYGRAATSVESDWVHTVMQPTPDVSWHPCPKPVGLLRWLVERFTAPGDLVLDPFAGSGTTLVAAQSLGRRAIGIESEQRYCDWMRWRLGHQTLPLPLPLEVPDAASS